MVTKSPPADKIDIFEVLAAVDSRDMDWYDRQSMERLKTLPMPVLMKWASAVSDSSTAETQVTRINQRVNSGLWELQSYPDLVYRLIASCGGGKKLRHQWIGKSKSSKAKGGEKLRDFISRYYPTAGDQEIDVLLDCYQRADGGIEGFLNDTGCDEQERKEILGIFNEYSNRN